MDDRSISKDGLRTMSENPKKLHDFDTESLYSQASADPLRMDHDIAQLLRTYADVDVESLHGDKTEDPRKDAVVEDKEPVLRSRSSASKQEIEEREGSDGSRASVKDDPASAVHGNSLSISKPAVDSFDAGEGENSTSIRESACGEVTADAIESE